jgi:hypothetical protein
MAGMWTFASRRRGIERSLSCEPSQQSSRDRWGKLSSTTRCIRWRPVSSEGRADALKQKSAKESPNALVVFNPGQEHAKALPDRSLAIRPLASCYSVAFAMSSTTFLASPKTIMVLSM